MTWNFSLVAIDQIVNNAAKIRQMSGGQFKVPIVFRGPGGAGRAGRRAALAVRSSTSTPRARAQGGDAVDAGRRQGPAQDRDPRRRPGGLHRGRDALQREGRGPRGRRTLVPLGKGDVKREGTDVTIVAWSKMVPRRARGGRASSPRRASRSRSSTRAPRPLDEDADPASRCARPTAASSSRRAGRSPASAPRSRTACSARCFDELDAPIERVHRARRADAVRAQPRGRWSCPTVPTRRRRRQARAVPRRSERDGPDHRLCRSSLRRWKRACSCEVDQEGRRQDRRPATSSPRSRPTRRTWSSPSRTRACC